jgi:hypothetical protein
MVAVASCGGPASAPAPQIELPSPAILKFVGYQSLAVDLTTLQNAGAQANASLSKTYPVGTDLSDIIPLGPIFFSTFEELVFQSALAGLEELTIPTKDATTGTPTTRFTALQFSFSSASGALSGKQDVKIDFAPFDYDGKGTGLDCSGNALTPPICVRFWLGGARFLAGIFDTPPVYTQETDVVPLTLGSGKFKVIVRGVEGFNANFAYHYEDVAQVTAGKIVRHWFSIKRDVGAVLAPEMAYVDKWYGHAEIGQAGSGNGAFKGINFTTEILGMIPIVLNVTIKDVQERYIGQFVEGYDFWGGSVLADFDIVSGEFSLPPPYEQTDNCASISTALEVELANCDLVGGFPLRTTGMEYVVPATDADVDISEAAFPLTAPF